MICCVGDIIKRRLGSFFPLDHIEYTFSNRTMDKQIFWPVTFVRIEPNFFFVYVRTYIYTDVLQTFIYIPAFVTHNQYGSGRLIKLERRVDKRPQCRSNSASPSTLYPVHTHKHTKRKLSTFFSLFLMQLSEQNEKKKTHPSPPLKLMDGCCWGRQRQKRRDGSVQSSLVGGAHLAQHQQEKHSQNAIEWSRHSFQQLKF